MTKRSDRKALTAAKVRDAAKELFTTKGWEGATIRGIADRAKMSTGAVFANFESKEALYRAVMGHHVVPPEVGRIAVVRLALIRRAMHPTDLANLEASIGSRIDDVLELAKWEEPSR